MLLSVSTIVCSSDLSQEPLLSILFLTTRRSASHRTCEVGGETVTAHLRSLSRASRATNRFNGLRGALGENRRRMLACSAPLHMNAYAHKLPTNERCCVIVVPSSRSPPALIPGFGNQRLQTDVNRLKSHPCTGAQTGNYCIDSSTPIFLEN